MRLVVPLNAHDVPRGCRQNNRVSRTQARIGQIARNAAAFWAYRGGHAPPWREGQESILSPMPPLIPLWVVGAGCRRWRRGGIPGTSPAPRRRPRPDRGHSPGPPRDTPPPGPPSGPRPGYSPPGAPGSVPSGRASPVRPRPDAAGNSAPFCARPLQMAALGAGGLGMDLDRAGIDQPRRAIRCVPHCRPQSGPYAPIAPPAEAAMGMLPVAGVGGQVPTAPRCAESKTRRSETGDCPRPPHLTWTSQQQEFPPWPDAVREVVAPVCGSHVRLLLTFCAPSVYPQIPSLTTPPRERQHK